MQELVTSMPPAKRVKKSLSPTTGALSTPPRPRAVVSESLQPSPISSTKLNVDAGKENMNNEDNGDVHDEIDDNSLLSVGGDSLEPGDLHDQHSEDHAKALRGKAYAMNGGYDALKSFQGQVYRGMAVGGSHTWNYDPGVWKETKLEPDLWHIDYETIKRRAKAAPRGSGAPVGTEYHWLIVSHQYVKKTDANTYETHLVGSKYKLAHKNANSNTWSIPKVAMQRQHEIELLEDAKRRVQGLPPVLATEKVKVDKREKGQQKLDSLFSKGAVSKTDVVEENGKKRKRESTDAQDGDLTS